MFFTVSGREACARILNCRCRFSVQGVVHSYFSPFSICVANRKFKNLKYFTYLFAFLLCGKMLGLPSTV